MRKRPDFFDSENPLTVAQLILLLQQCPQDAPVYVPDRGCGCCSWHDGVGVSVDEKVYVSEIYDEPTRVLLFHIYETD